MTINDLPIGAVVRDEKSLYNNEIIEWIIIDKNHEGYPVNSVTLLTKNTIPIPDEYTIKSKYESGSLREWFNSIFFYNLSKGMQKALLLTDIISNNVILKDKLFLLSYTEVGNLTVPREGGEFEYLKQGKNRAANHNWWTRTSDSSWFRWVVSNGGFDYGGSFSPSFAQLRIACNISINTLVDNNNNLLMSTDKLLIEQEGKYYNINNNYQELGILKDNLELENWYKRYGVDDVNIITQNLNNKEFPMSKDENGIWETDFQLDMNEVIDNIELVDIDEENKSIKYNCNDYRILDLCDNQFKLTMCKSK
ncbi:DUF6273 domain-containing protein [Clostridium sporogenes]|uniref:DUF6273 domain-containing protein n=1 Tax=Clostridium sporogenes TaxID=1509 RepID=UPI001FAC45E8|nr:DUF6273 domain-containing protein [Clostridium sporogenes]